MSPSSPCCLDARDLVKETTADTLPLYPFCAATIFGQREGRRDQSHVWSQDILESLASESSFHHHLSHTPSVNIAMDIHCPRSGQMCRMACIGVWNFASEIHVVQVESKD